MKTQDLQRVVETLKPAFKLNDIAEFGKYIIFSNNKAFVYNGLMAIIVEFESEKEFAVPADEFSKFIMRVKAKEVEISIADSIEIKAGKAKASFAKNNEILKSAKELNLRVPDKFEDLPEDFLKGLKLVQYSVGKDKSYENLTYVSIVGAIMASTDNFRVSEFVMKSVMEDTMIPNDTIKYLLSFGVKSYNKEDGICFFKDSNGVILLTRVGSLMFPDYASFLEGEGEEVEFPENMQDMVSTASVTVEGLVEIDKNVKIAIADNKITVSSKNDVGEIVVDGDIECEKTISLMIHPEFLNDILKVTRKVMICSNRVLFELENFRHVVALLN